MKKRLLFLALVVFAAGGMMLALSAAPAAQEAGQAEPYTATSFGPWNAAVAKVHVPEVMLEKMGSALMVTVKVDNHPMDPNKPHYIMWVRVEDADGKVLAKHDFKANDPAPTAVFHLNTFPEKLKVLERCNVHGIWMNEVAVDLK